MIAYGIRWPSIAEASELLRRRIERAQYVARLRERLADLAGISARYPGRVHPRYQNGYQLCSQEPIGSLPSPDGASDSRTVADVVASPAASCEQLSFGQAAKPQ